MANINEIPVMVKVKVNWEQKLTSRKLWLSVAGLVVGIMLLFGASEGMTTQISGVIMSLGSVIAYIVGEGLVDAAGAGAAVNNIIGGNAPTAGQEATTPTSAPVIGTADTSPDATDSESTGAAQAAEVKQDTAESSKQQ